MALKKRDLNLGDRVCSTFHGPGHIISGQSSDVISRYSFMSPAERQTYIWVKFDNGNVEGWRGQLPEGFTRKITLEDKVEAARQALAEAEAELAESRTPKVGERYSSVINNTTATVKAVVDGVIYYEYVFAGSKEYAGRTAESFRKTYETKLVNC